MSDDDLKSYIKSYYLNRKMTYTKLDKHDRAIGVLLKENNQLKSILTELEDELNIAFKELQPGELVIGQNILKNIQITIQELKEKYK